MWICIISGVSAGQGYELKDSPTTFKIGRGGRVISTSITDLWWFAEGPGEYNVTMDENTYSSKVGLSAAFASATRCAFSQLIIATPLNCAIVYSILEYTARCFVPRLLTFVAHTHTHSLSLANTSITRNPSCHTLRHLTFRHAQLYVQTISNMLLFSEEQTHTSCALISDSYSRVRTHVHLY